LASESKDLVLAGRLLPEYGRVVILSFIDVALSRRILGRHCRRRLVQLCLGNVGLLPTPLPNECRLGVHPISQKLGLLEVINPHGHLHAEKMRKDLLQLGKLIFITHGGPIS
jgi:hypothetical protein